MIQFILTVLSSGVLAAVITAALNISIQMRTLQINRIEEFADCLYRMSTINNDLYWKYVAQRKFQKLEQWNEVTNYRQEAEKLQIEFDRLFTRSLTITAVVDLDKMHLRKFRLSCMQMVQLAMKEDHEENIKAGLNALAFERDEHMENLVDIARSRIKELQVIWRLFHRL